MSETVWKFKVLLVQRVRVVLRDLQDPAVPMENEVVPELLALKVSE